jgi:iron complex outermembrane receptor protein
VISRGVEAEAMAHPIRGLTLHASADYDDAYYGSYSNGPCPAGSTQTTCSLTGRPVVGAPRWSTNAYGLYEHRIADHLIGYVRAEYSWRSHFYGYQDDSSQTRTGDYTLVNLYVGVKDPSGHWDLMVWGKNVGDAHYPITYGSYGTLLPGLYVPFFGDPATYGVTLRASF